MAISARHFKKRADFNKLRELVATPLGNVFCADRSVEDLEATKKDCTKGWSPTGLYFLSWNDYNGKPVAQGNKACVGLYMTCMFMLQTMKRKHTAREALFLIFSHHQSCSESCFLFDCQIVSQKLGTRNRECKLSYKRILDNKNYINGLKVRGNCMKYMSVTFWETGETQHGECAIATIVSCLQPGEEWTKE